MGARADLLLVDAGGSWPQVRMSLTLPYSSAACRYTPGTILEAMHMSTGTEPRAAKRLGEVPTVHPSVRAGNSELGS